MVAQPMLQTLVHSTSGSAAALCPLRRFRCCLCCRLSNLTFVYTAAERRSDCPAGAAVTGPTVAAPVLHLPAASAAGSAEPLEPWGAAGTAMLRGASIAAGELWARTGAADGFNGRPVLRPHSGHSDHGTRCPLLRACVSMRLRQDAQHRQIS